MVLAAQPSTLFALEQVRGQSSCKDIQGWFSTNEACSHELAHHYKYAHVTVNLE